MWDLPGPGVDPVSPALAGGFLTTAPPGKSLSLFLNVCILPLHWMILILSPHRINRLPGYKIQLWTPSSFRLSLLCSIVLQDPMLLQKRLKPFWFLILSMHLGFLSGNLQDLLFIPTFWNLTMTCLDTNLFSSNVWTRCGSHLGLYGLQCWETILNSFIISPFCFLCPDHSPRLIFRFFSFSPHFFFLTFCFTF